MEQPEIHPPHHPHGGLPRWLEWVTSVSALIVSVTSIVIAVHSGNTMERLVTANSFPYLWAGSSDITPEGKKTLSVDLNSSGVGPAHEKSFKIKVGDHYATSVADLVATIVGPGDAAAANTVIHAYMNVVPDRFIAANASQFVFRIPRTDENARYWDMLDKSANDWHYEFCYCSVFEECWQVRDTERKPIKRCVRDEPHEFTP
jgi:hypothetical protein